MRKFARFFIVIYLVVNIVASCSDIDNYSISPNIRLSFSQDTISFDTVFTAIGSTTKYFMIYNNNDEAVKIETIILANGNKSGFRINVDGRKGNTFHDIPVWKKDSLYIGVEVTINPNDSLNPFILNDSIVFITNGAHQAVVLEAYGQNVVILKGGKTFEHDTTLTADLPYLVYDSITISKDVTITINEGAKFYMHNNAKWKIDGTIKANGTLEKPVTFRGDRLDKFGEYTDYNHLTAQWNGMYFGSESFDNTLSYTEIRSGQYGLIFYNSNPDRQKIKIDNSIITNMSNDGFRATNCNITAVNSEFSNAGWHLILLEGGKYQFTHCTIANYIMGGLVNGSIARLFPTFTLTDSLPLQQAYFDNCIIDGSNTSDSTNMYSGEISFITDSYSDGNNENFNYRFNHCFIKTASISNDRFIDCLFVNSPSYLKSDGKNKEDNNDLIYDFRLADESVGIGSADREITAKYPTDRLGINRLESEKGPSIGAYEYVKQEKEKEDK